MTSKNSLYALAVVVLLMGSMAGVALADHQETAGMYGPADYSVSAQPEQGVEQPDTGEIREPVETGAVPEWSLSSSDLNCCTDRGVSTVEIGGQMFRPNVDLGP